LRRIPALAYPGLGVLLVAAYLVAPPGLAGAVIYVFFLVIAKGSAVAAGWLGAYLLAGAAGLHPSVQRSPQAAKEPSRQLAGFRAALWAAG